MDLGLKDKRALVTGASSGIGAEIAETLAREGAHVLVHGRDRRRAHAVVAKLKAGGARADAVLGDLTSDREVGAVARQVEQLAGGIDVLVNNAGGAEDLAPWGSTSLERWRSSYETNVLSIVRLLHSFLPAMREAGWGRIVNVASGVAMQPFPKQVVRTMAQDNGWGDDWAAIEKKFVAQLVPNPVGRIGLPAEVADAVAFLASPRAAYIHGANLRIDGGYVASVN